MRESRHIILEVQEGAIPRIPQATNCTICCQRQDLERLERAGLIQKVPYSGWAAPLVPIPKGDEGIRLCGDFKVTVNPVLKVDQ